MGIFPVSFVLLIYCKLVSFLLFFLMNAENHASLILTDCPRGECCECGDTNGDCNPHDEDGKCCDYYLPDGTCCPCGGEEAYPGMWLCHPRDNNGECCPDFMWDWENRFQCCECGVTMVNGYKKCNAKDGAGKCCIAYSTDGACCPCGASLVDGALKCHEEDWVGNCCEAYLADGTCCPCGTIHVEGTVRCNVKDWIGNCCVAYLKDGTCCRKEDSLCLLTKSLQTQG